MSSCSVLGTQDQARTLLKGRSATLPRSARAYQTIWVLLATRVFTCWRGYHPPFSTYTNLSLGAYIYHLRGAMQALLRRHALHFTKAHPTARQLQVMLLATTGGRLLPWSSCVGFPSPSLAWLRSMPSRPRPLALPVPTGAGFWNHQPLHHWRNRRR